MGYSREFNNSAEAGNFSLPSSVRYFSVTRLVLLDFLVYKFSVLTTNGTMFLILCVCIFFARKIVYRISIEYYDLMSSDITI